MSRLYAPWRPSYVAKMPEDRREKTKDECVFCMQLQSRDDDKYFIIKRFEFSVLMMNFYPYNVGHVMVLPLEHKADLTDLKQIERAEMMEVTSLCQEVMSKTLTCEGFNIGINLGIAGGGGIPSHLHIHVLPRWRGDTNFLETLGQTKLLSVDMEKTFKDLKAAFAHQILEK